MIFRCSRRRFCARCSHAYPGYDITLYKHALFEPLCAVYRRTCLPALEELIDHQEYRIIDLFPTLSVNVIRTDQREAFQSINTPEDYAAAAEERDWDREGIRERGAGFGIGYGVRGQKGRFKVSGLRFNVKP